VAGLTDAAAEPTDPPGFDAVYADARERVVRTAFLIVGSRAVAEELAQEAFLRLYQRFAEVENPGGFLRTAVVRLCLSWRRRETLEASRYAVLGEPGPTGAPEIDGAWEALGALPPERRAALVLRFYEGLDHAEIAALMGCRVSTARTRVHRGLADLRRELER
jgi:DNA-directed RNA polymerase specialized sigma24 family protein